MRVSGFVVAKTDIIEETHTYCVECKKECEIIQERTVDFEPYGDQRVARVEYYEVSHCCGSEVLEFVIETEAIIH